MNVTSSIDQCPEVAVLLNAAIDPSLAGGVQEHCGMCARCAGVLDQARDAEAAMAPVREIIDCDEAEAIGWDSPPEQLALLLTHLRRCQDCSERIQVMPHLLDPHSAETEDPFQPGRCIIYNTAELLVDNARGVSASFDPAAIGIGAGLAMTHPLPSVTSPMVSFVGNGRFELKRCLGAGGMGVVFEAFDRQEDRTVALKVATKSNGNPDVLRRLKQEFRSPQGLRHPNLVALDTLFEDDGHWFLTMELVRGEHALHWAQTADPETSLDPLGYNERRVRSMLEQLAHGLSALHSAGKIHRDVKPSNILVTGEGRLVLLDFGLITDVHQSDSSVRHVVGTPAYMAPEQAAGKPVDPAADWYSVGVLLYQTLTGRLPFTGTKLELFMRKQCQRPIPPIELSPAIPPDLNDLCMDLLAFTPAKRPNAREVLRRLGLPDSHLISHSLSLSSLYQQPFVGRDRELDALCEAFDHSRVWGAVTVFIHGESGVGKSALVQHFDSFLRHSNDDILLLSGRCYEHESVPYKAFDNIVDALSVYLAQFSRVELGELLQHKTWLLSQVFPVLGSVERRVAAPEVTQAVRDPLELRTQMFAALRGLLARIAQRQPLVLIIDDLQWADSDSLALLGEIMRPPDAPRLLLLATMRNAASGGVAAPIAASVSGDVRRIPLGRLDRVEARELTSLLLEQNGVDGAQYANALTNEAQGHPLFIHELVRHVALGAATHDLRLDEALWARIKTLEPAARHLVELAAVAGRPVARDTLGRAAGVGGESFRQHVALLRVAHLLRTARGKSDTLEPYHDRVREAVLTKLNASHRKLCHERLAVALELDGAIDPETLATHWEGAGEAKRARAFALDAAEQANSALAFDRAARLYRKVLAFDREISAHTDAAGRRAITIKLAYALKNAGRGADAAEAFLAAADGADENHAFDLKRLAAENLLHAGHIDEGLAALTELLGAVGLSMPSSPRRALMSMLLRRARLRVRGLGFRERHETVVDKDNLTKLDVCWSAGIGLTGVDVFRSSYFHAQYLHLSLNVGEPYRIARALAVEGAHRAVFGVSRRKQATAILDTATAIAARLNEPRVIAFAKASRGVAAYMWGDWHDAYRLATEAENMFRSRCTGVSFELSLTQLFVLGSLFYKGDLAMLSALGPKLAREAADRSDRYAWTSFQTGLPNARWLVHDDVDGARAARVDAMKRWSRAGVHMQHKEDFVARQHIDLYAGDGEAAWRDAEATWPELERALILRFQLARTECLYSRGRSAVSAAAARGSKDRADLLTEAERAARRLTRENLAHARAMAHAIRAGAAAVCGDVDAAASRLEQAEGEFESAAMELHLAAVQRQRGRLIGGDEGEALIAEADRWMGLQNIAIPERMANMLAPGFSDR